MKRRILKKIWKRANMRRVVLIDRSAMLVVIDQPTFLGFTRLHLSGSFAKARLGKMLCTSNTPRGYSKNAVRQVIDHARRQA